jgi:hypothetical protein
MDLLSRLWNSVFSSEEVPVARPTQIRGAARLEEFEKVRAEIAALCARQPSRAQNAAPALTTDSHGSARSP